MVVGFNKIYKKINYTMEHILEYEQFAGESLNESQIIYDGVKVNAAGDKTGRLLLTYGTTKVYYKIKAKVKALITLYEGPIGVVAAWQDDKKQCWVKDNTGKLFKLDTETLKTLAAKAKAKAPLIAFTGTGEVKGVSGTYDATLTKVA
jgi:hypothetical protein